MMNIVIIEDEPATARRLKKMLAEIAPDFNITAIIDSVEDSIDHFQGAPEPDLVFMDIHLADGTSFEIFEKTEVNSPVIFTTAYDEYAIKAFKVNSIDYLLKPIKIDELSAAVEKFRKTIKSNVPDYSSLLNLLQPEKKVNLKRFMVKINQVIKAVNVDDVAYFFTENKSVYAVLKSGNRYLTDFTMERLNVDLNPTDFFRINRSMIVNYAAISSMIAYSKSRIKIELEPPHKADVVTSTERSAKFKQWLSGKV